MSKKLDFSIILCVYNGEKFIGEALESVYNQTYKNYEIICINDGSNDNTEKIIEKYKFKFKNFIYIKHKNMGLASSRNKALQIANGNYIQFLDADDKLHENCCEELKKFINNKNLDIISYSGWNNDNGILFPNPYWQYDKINHKLLNKELRPCDFYKFIFQLPVSSCISIYRNEFLRSQKISFPDGFFFEDNVFFYESFFNAKRYAILNKKLYERRLHNLQITKIKNNILFDCFYIYIKCLNLFNIFTDPYLTYQYYRRKLKFLKSLQKYFRGEDAKNFNIQLEEFDKNYRNLKINNKLKLYNDCSSHDNFDKDNIEKLKFYSFIASLGNEYYKLINFRTKILLNQFMNDNGYCKLYEASLPFIPKISIIIFLSESYLLLNLFVEQIKKQYLKEIEIILVTYVVFKIQLYDIFEVIKKNYNISFYFINNINSFEKAINNFRGEYCCLMKEEEFYHNEQFLYILYKNSLLNKIKSYKKIIYNSIFCYMPN